MNNEQQHDTTRGHATPAPTPSTQGIEGSGTAAGTEQEDLAFKLYTSSCFFRQAYNGFILARLCGAEWNTPEELEARGYTLIDTGFTFTPRGPTGAPAIKIQQVQEENGRRIALFYLRPPHGKGMLVPILGDIYSDDSIYYMNMAEKIAVSSLRQQGASPTPAVTGRTEELNSFLQFCKNHLVSERTLCPACLVKIGWGKNKTFGTSQFRLSDLFSLETDQPLPLCLLFRVQDDHGVLLTCDYDTAHAAYRATAGEAPPGADLFQSDWINGLFKETHKSHIYRGPRP